MSAEWEPPCYVCEERCVQVSPDEFQCPSCWTLHRRAIDDRGRVRPVKEPQELPSYGLQRIFAAHMEVRQVERTRQKELDDAVTDAAEKLVLRRLLRKHGAKAAVGEQDPLVKILRGEDS